jgi:hypothetical protein
MEIHRPWPSQQYGNAFPFRIDGRGATYELSLKDDPQFVVAFWRLELVGDFATPGKNSSWDSGVGRYNSRWHVLG